MASYLALDLATATGAAFWRPGMAWPRSWLLNLPQGAETGIWLDELYQWALEFVRLEQITDIAVETPLIGFGGEEKNFKLIGAAGVIRMIGAQVTRERIGRSGRDDTGMPCKVELIANQKFFVHWVGSNDFHGDARKARSVLAAQARGMGKVTNHNIADSIGVLTYRLHTLNLHKQVPWNIQKGMVNTLFEAKGTRIEPTNTRAAQRLVNSAVSFDRKRSDGT